MEKEMATDKTGKTKAPARRPLAVVVLAAGEGKRMRSDLPKVLHEVAGRAMIDHVLASARVLKPERLVVVVGDGAEAVRSRVGDGDGGDLRCVLQAEQLGTGHAVLQARSALRGFDGDVLVLCGDVPLLTTSTLRSLLKQHGRNTALATVLGMAVDDPSGYGRIIREMDGRLSVVEHRDATAAQREVFEVNSGTWCFDARFMLKALAGLGRDNAQGEYYLTDLLAMASARDSAAAWVMDDDSEGLGVNSRHDLAQAEMLMQERLIAGWMDKGVSFLDPATVTLSCDARLGRDTVVGPGARIWGNTRIGRNCVLDGNCFLNDSQVGDRVHLRWGVVASGASVGKGSLLGPYAHLRPEARLDEEVHVGNFVEIKKSRLGRGSKANHLSYIGDAQLGRDVNVGAGTITCNYDGYQKYRTIIGDRVQIGSDTQLVAPVRLGNDSYVAAGSTVSSDVEDGALVFNDKPQRVRKGWVAGFRRRMKRLKKGSAS